MNTFDPHLHVKQVIVVGLGGCAVARIAARMLYDMRRRQMHTPRMVLIDPDRVEEKNVGRQAVFVPAEIGEYKTTAVGRKLNLALELDIAVNSSVTVEKVNEATSSIPV